MSRIALALMFGSAVLLASDASFARPRGRVSSPPPKPAASQPAKAGSNQLLKQATKPQQPGEAGSQKPFAAAPRPERSTFISINPRPFGAAPAGTAPAHGALHDGAQGLRPLQYDPDLGPLEESAVLDRGEPIRPASVTQLEAAVKRQVSERPKVAPGTTNLEMAQPWTPAVTDKSRPAPAAAVCYVQPSGACVPF